MSEENKALVRRMYEDWNSEGRFPDEIFAPGFQAHIAGAPPVDLAEFQRDMQVFYTAFSNFSFTFEDMVAENDRVAVRTAVRATHTADFMGIPARGAQISVVSTGIARIAGGKIAEWWNSPDRLGIMQQVGAFPAPEQTE